MAESHADAVGAPSHATAPPVVATGMYAPAAPSGPWLRSARWDLSLLILSAFVLVPIPYVLHHMLAWSPSQVSLVVMLLIGGPHVAVTYLRTWFEPRFTGAYPKYAWGALLIPAAIVTFIYFGGVSLFLLFFFMAASIHVLHQNYFIIACYDQRDPHARRKARWSFGIDLLFCFSLLYPMAVWLLSRDGGELTFILDWRVLWFPEFLRGTDWPWIAMSAIAGLATILFYGKTLREWRAGTVNWPKVLLISLAAWIGFALPFLPDAPIRPQGQ